jgi:ribonucleoside-diphosphate reductase alpha subunit
MYIQRMQVVKRDKRLEPVDFNKITKRITLLSNEISTDGSIDPIKVAQKVCNSLYDKVTTKELDELSAEIAVSLSTDHPDYGILASRLCMNNLHKNTLGHFGKVVHKLCEHDLVSQQLVDVYEQHSDTILNAMDYNRDYMFDFFGMKTLMKSYLIKVANECVERPQDMMMRVAIGIHGHDMERVLETYEHTSKKLFTHATPTLFNAGTNFPQLSSCYLMEMEDDSISGIYNTLGECAQISKWAGGIGLHIHKLRATGSDIRNAKGVCTGIVPSLRVFNATSRYVNQGGKRPGSIAIYLAVDHPDIFKLLDLRKNHGDEDERCRDLFYGIWVSDLFMQRVRNNEKWSLFCPSKIPSSLQDVYGDDYNQMYIEYESKGLYTRQVDAQSLWYAICNAQIETGTPYILYKDMINKKSNQKNVGVIKSSNLCTEIVEYTSPDEIAVCNLASIALPMFVRPDRTFDHGALHHIVKCITLNLNRVIEVNFYPVEKARRSNLRHRPIGIGVQGLADVYMMMGFPFDSHEASVINEAIFETIYHGALERSMELAIQESPYDTFEGSPASQGILQFDLWGFTPKNSRYDWETLKQNIRTHGLRNSLLIAPMPTASTSQILGNNECFEPYTSNIYLRRTLAGEFVVINKHLVRDLLRIGLWNRKLKDKIVYHNGSVQNIQEIPQNIKNLYKTSWELKQKVLIDQAVGRGKYICQSQSMNLFVARPTIKLLSSMHFYSWEQGLKTGIYYLRTQPASVPVPVTLDPSLICETCSS